MEADSRLDEESLVEAPPSTRDLPNKHDGREDFSNEMANGKVQQSEKEEGHAQAMDPTVANDDNLEVDSNQAWWLAFGGFLVFFNIWGLPISFGAFQDFYVLNLLSDYSSSTISWIGTIQGCLLILVGLVSGPLYDLGYWYLLLGLGSFLSVSGMMMLSLSTEYYQIILSQGICVGIGCGLLYVPVLTVLGAAFKQKRAMAMGVATSGVGLGGIIYTIIWLRLIPVLGFPWTVRVMGFVCLTAFLTAAPMLHRRRKSGSKNSRQLFDKAALTDVPFLIFTTAQFFIFLGYLVPLFYLPTFAQVALRIDEDAALYILVGSQAASLIGRLAAALPVPYSGVIAPWIACCTISGVLCFAWIAIRGMSGFIAYSVLYGFFSGAIVALPPSLFPVICPDPATLGSRMGISWASTAISFLIGTPIAGAIINVQAADFLGVQAWSGAMLLFGSVLIGVLWAVLARKEKRVMI